MTVKELRVPSNDFHFIFKSHLVSSERQTTNEYKNQLNAIQLGLAYSVSSIINR